jgi:5-formyltetrahydrofolate cyclo-ligase
LSSDQSKIRRTGRDARASLDELTRDAASSVVAEKIVSSAWFQRAQYLACYLPVANEVSTWGIISRAWRMKKRVFCPVCEINLRMQFREVSPDTDLRRNRYGVFEPVNGEIVTARMLDLVITPVVAFDHLRNRVGMGGGYFDRTFSFLRHRNDWLHPKLVGVAFACQQVTEITPNPWDIPLFAIVTEAGETRRQPANASD